MEHPTRPRRCPAPGPLILIAVALLAMPWAGCSRNEAKGVVLPPDVQVTTVRQQDVPLTREWIGTLDGSVNARIHAQVSGILVRQDYREGTHVSRGDPLFEIDPRPFEAALAQASGQLAQAQAQLQKARLDVERYTPLAADKAISQEELDDAVALRRSLLACFERTRQTTLAPSANNLSLPRKRDRHDIPREKWTPQDWDAHIADAENMLNLARQNPTMFKVGDWHEEVSRRMGQKSAALGDKNAEKV